MDLLSAFSLACGVIQVVDFSMKILSISKEICKNGSLKANDDVEDLTTQIRDLYVGLETPSSRTGAGNVSLPVQNKLLDLANKCKETSNELLEEFQKLKSSRKRDVLWKVPATLRRRKVLDSLESRLDSYRKAIESSILVHLRQQVFKVYHDQREIFSILEQFSRATAISFAENTDSFDRLAQILRDENSSLTEHITRQLNEMEQRATDAKYNEELLKSLHFPEINCREEEITVAYEETFQWIFDRHTQRIPPQSNFIDWLENGSKIYWINGKAGSGKSTLMNSVWQNQRTIIHLKAWVGQQKLIVPAFFFWASGSPLQKTLIGLLRSLVYQVLQKRPELLTSPIQETHHSGLPFPFGPKHEPITVWTEQKLLRYFYLLAGIVSSNCRICIFVDGLDEFSGKHRELVKFLLELVQNPAIKCCVSSRPEKPFDALGTSSIGFKLEDVTRSDIEKYVNGKLAEVPQYNSMSLDAREREIIVESILEKAEGVFLWVEVVVESQITMVGNDDDFEMLRSQLQDLPSEVEGLYAHMLDRIDSRYRAEAARYLQYTRLLIEDPVLRGLSIFDLSLAEFGLKENMQLKCINLDPQVIVSKCERVKERIRVACAGILEIREESVRSLEDEEVEYPSKSRRTYEVKTGFGWAQQKVKFHHRTAKDFLDQGGRGYDFLSRYPPPSVDANCLRAALLLGRIALCEAGVPSEFVSELISNMFYNFQRSLLHGGTISIHYLDYIDETLSRYHSQFYYNTEPALHWCESWGRRIRSDSEDNFTPDLKLLEEYRIQKALPRNFLFFAASWHLYDYVVEKIGRLQTPYSADAGLELLVCATINSIHLYYSKWMVSESQQIKLMAYLVSHGAVLQSEIGQVVWQLVLQSVLEALYYRQEEFLKESFYEANPTLFDGFLKAGAQHHTILILRIYFKKDRGKPFEVRYSTDTSSVPVIDYVKGKGKLPKARILQAGSTAIDKKASRVWFRRIGYYRSTFWPEDGWKLSYKQAQGLDQCVRRQIEATDDEERMQWKAEIVQKFAEIHEICAPACDPQWSGKVLPKGASEDSDIDDQERQ